MDGGHDDFRAPEHQHAREFRAPEFAADQEPDFAQVGVDHDALLARQQMPLPPIKVCIQRRGIGLLAQIARKLGALGTLKAEDFASIARDDGRKQTTYRGLPLYYFAGDKAPGETKGQGVKEVWFVAAP